MRKAGSKFTSLKTELERAGVDLVLASASPRRSVLLQECGLRHTILPSAVEEVVPTHFTPSEITLWNARAKAAHVARQQSEAVVIGADTLVVHRGRILGKPRTLKQAFGMLRHLSGETHEVFSGVWIERLCARQFRGFIEVSRVTFRELSDDEIRHSMELTDPLDKAGGYAAQSDPVGLIARIEGSRTNVIGLPMERLTEVLLGLLREIPGTGVSH